ncbi:uncharacterized protein BP01DRAFT_203724 [Aspergillus saccharolyticus JOP 1030-1]|uniref:Uncharacterized protein n=1 Tax=Aspergillus saccharolyticus JOP 1030-1 TaxID=1450539 RepID=A0A318Z063_9EURO|nr:hypothetical protein BP01DRAFT_203724 [Aspergillus saccharolyticus JOP 1030-1]PYH40645.1 hypothetical protein BP01DRAFT_203724 [Aspergillus saccharolyticus JOP 1030-1]
MSMQRTVMTYEPPFLHADSFLFSSKVLDATNLYFLSRLGFSWPTFYGHNLPLCLISVDFYRIRLLFYSFCLSLLLYRHCGVSFVMVILSQDRLDRRSFTSARVLASFFQMDFDLSSSNPCLMLGEILLIRRLFLMEWSRN